MATHQYQTSPAGMVAPDSTLAPPAVVETDSSTRHVPSMLRIHIQDAQLPKGCNPYAVVSVGNNSARSKQLLSSENAALASTGFANFDEQFVVEYDPRHSKDNFVSVAFFERSTDAPLGEWRAPISNFDHSHHGLLGIFGKHTPSPHEISWELLEGVNVPLTPYAGPAQTTHTHGGLLSHLKPHHHTTSTTTPATIEPASATTLGTAHIRVRSEPKLVGTMKLAVREVIIPGTTAPILLNLKFNAPEQRFSTELINGAEGRFVFPSSEFLFRVDPSNNVRDIFIEVVQNGVIVGETRVTLYDAYRPGGLAAVQPILIHSTKTRIGDMILSSSFEGKVQKR